MILGIDGTNARSGGSRTHLREIMLRAKPEAYGFSKVIIWGGHTTLEPLENRPWLQKIHFDVFEEKFVKRALWQKFQLNKHAVAAGCDLMFVPGGSFAAGTLPVVTMCRNMLPFEWRELRRYGWSPIILKFLALRWTQSRSFMKAQGTIFLTDYARKQAEKVTGDLSATGRIIPHGVDERFASAPRPQREFCDYDALNPVRAIYVSSVDAYKHQWRVAEAIARLVREGAPITIDFVGAELDVPSVKRLEKTIRRLDPGGKFLFCRGALPHTKIHALYQEADLAIFASSCENMPNILLESMASGLPIACAQRGPMPDILGDGGIYFDPEHSQDIADALQKLITSQQLRRQLANIAFERAKAYSWQHCYEETFQFLHDVATMHANKHNNKGSI